MADPERSGESLPETGRENGGEGSALPGNLLNRPDGDVSSPNEPSTLKRLTKDEQMALYEKELKEEDWGHQPC